MKSLLIGLILTTSIGSFANSENSTNKNICTIKTITCLGCEEDVSTIERTKDALLKRGYVFDENDTSGQEVKVEYNQMKPVANKRIQSICQYQHDSEAGFLKSLVGLDWTRHCDFSTKEEKERLRYIEGGANFHSLFVQTSAHSQGFQTTKELNDKSNLSGSFDSMLRSMDLPDCL